ncbi:MAG TPA: hypothetical protein VL177_08250, partial [Terriglobales bacterium]|nr:hypothetical protein [Terriglobales bacterium]
ATVAREHSNRGDMIAQFFNTDSFVPTNLVPRGVYGNAGRNIISGLAFIRTSTGPRAVTTCASA